MFTGIVTDIGAVRRVRARQWRRDPDDRDRLRHRRDRARRLDRLLRGMPDRHCAAARSLSAPMPRPRRWRCSTLGDWREGTPRQSRTGDEVRRRDGRASRARPCRRRRPARRAAAGWRTRCASPIEAPAELAPFIAAKGSVALDGVSLTVNEVEGRVFGVNIIPHTLTHTTFGDAAAGAADEPRNRPDRPLCRSGCCRHGERA